MSPRIVAGTARGRRLAAAATGTRPTSERAREALFNTLAGLVDLPGARVLDLYAGTGAVGLEALSRGAAQAVLVESGRAALAVLRRNLAALDLPGALLRPVDVSAYLSAVARGDTAGSPDDSTTAPGDTAGTPGDGPFDLVFADPPYALPPAALDRVLAALPPLLAAGAVLAVERSARGSGPTWPEGVTPLRERRYGEAVLWYGLAR